MKRKPTSVQPNDTIAAISTAQGEGGIGIVRLSGPAAVSIAASVFAAHQGQPLANRPAFSLSYGSVVDPANGEKVDEAIVGVMRAPRSYTREDVAEINVHGGAEPLRRALDLVLAAGARLAEPGEFTRRAFENGRLDLAQAEAVIDVIRARTKRASDIAARQLSGELSARLARIEASLADALALLEASVDFSDEDLSLPPRENVLTYLDNAATDIDKLLSGAGEGELVRSGVRLAIVGKPNVGKSSLLNALLNRERAIVTAVPGTTRDTLEETIAIDGIPFVVTDTAGIRDTDDAIESHGVERSRQSLAGADVAAVIVDASAGISIEDAGVIEEAGGCPVLVAANKSDLLCRRGETRGRELVPPGIPVVFVSAKTGEGVSEFRQACRALVLGARIDATNEVMISSARQADALRRAAAALARARDALASGLSEEFAAGEIYGALDCVGEITGRTVSSEILDRIFERFCIGK